MKCQQSIVSLHVNVHMDLAEKDMLLYRAVRSIAVDSSNEWFVTGSADRTIKIWDLASGQLKLTLTGHIEQVHAIITSLKGCLVKKLLRMASGRMV